MRLLLDTHAFLWLVGAPERLSDAALAACSDAASELWISVASAWEMQIKQALGKLMLPVDVTTLVAEQQRVNGLKVLSVELAHVAQLSALPPLHRDPFDRLLVAQALVGGYTLVSSDAAVAAYPVARLW